MINASAPDLAGEYRAEPVPLEAARLVADVDAALVRQVVDVAQREQKPDIQHHRQSDGLGAAFEAAERIWLGDACTVGPAILNASRVPLTAPSLNASWVPLTLLSLPAVDLHRINQMAKGERHFLLLRRIQICQQRRKVLTLNLGGAGEGDGTGRRQRHEGRASVGWVRATDCETVLFQTVDQ